MNELLPKERDVIHKEVKSLVPNHRLSENCSETMYKFFKVLVL